MGCGNKNAWQGELLYNRLVKRYKHLKKWAKRAGTDAYRLYDRDIPEIPLVLDLYGDAVSGALYKRPYEKDETEEEAWLLAMKVSVSKALEINEDNIILKERRRLRKRQEGSQYQKMARQNFFRDVHEGDLIFRVNLSDYLDSGLFLDARKKRAFIRMEAEGKRVLNLFAYTCSLSVAAAKGGAKQVDSVDLSNTYLEWGKVNFALNSIKEQGLIQSDAVRFLEQAAGRKQKWELIILDPPSFSNSKKMKGVFYVKRDYKELINRTLSILSSEGKLIFSSNAKGDFFDPDDFAVYKTKDLTLELTDEDFRGKKTPLCWLFER